LFENIEQTELWNTFQIHFKCNSTGLMTPKNKTIMWLGFFIASIIISYNILPFPYGQLLALIAFIMTIKSGVRYFKQRKRWRGQRYAERKGWDRHYYGDSIAKKAVQSLALVLVISVTGVLLLLQNGSIDFDTLDIQAVEDNVHKLVNEERQKAGLSQLAYDTKLEKIAEGHSNDMANRKYVAHASPEGVNFYERYQNAGYNCKNQISGENVAQNNLFIISSPESVAKLIVDQWMNSPEHRKNILQPQYKREGIGISIAGLQIYATQNFC